jgi:uncharacterized protein
MNPRGARRLGRIVAAAAVTALLAGAVPAWTPSGHPPVAAAQAQDSLAVPEDRTGLAAIPPFVGFVNDGANVLDAQTRAQLEAFLTQLRDKTGAEFAILTVPSTAPEAPDQYKVRVFESWKIGKRGEDNGLLMLLAVEERELRFETGYGLEGTLPDGLQSRIFREDMAPRFATGDFAAGIVAGVLACAQRIAAERNVTLVWNGEELRYSGAKRDGPSPLMLALFVVGVLVILVLSNSGGGGWGGGRRRRRGGGVFFPGGGWGGGWGGGLGGGGFGGGGFGGGGFGGGGSFGGFGGGASGGGGGGGKW